MTERQKEIKDLEAFFKANIIPSFPIKLNVAVTVNNPQKMVTNTLDMLNAGTAPEISIMARLHDLRILKKMME